MRQPWDTAALTAISDSAHRVDGARAQLRDRIKAARADDGAGGPYTIREIAAASRLGTRTVCRIIDGDWDHY